MRKCAITKVVISVTLVLSLLLSSFSFHLVCATEPENDAAIGPVGIDAMNSDGLEQIPFLKQYVICEQQSSFDRDGGNNDLFDVTQTNQTLLDVKGVGTLYRIWMTGFTSNSRIRVYIDGETTPRINMLTTDFFSGTQAPFLSPLVGDNQKSSGGFYSYYPIQFAQSIKIVGDHIQYYHMNYHRYPNGTQLSSFSGNEDTLAVRTIWNRLIVDKVVADPKPTSGNTVINGSTTLAANTTATMAQITGSRSISSIKLKLDEINKIAEPTITEDGRAYRGYSQFNVAITAGRQVKMVKRIDYGIADQKVNVYCDNALVGQNFASGSDTFNRWKDIEFLIPASFTVGKSSITIKNKFVSSKNDANEFYYWIYSDDGNGGWTLTDQLDVGKTNDEQGHGYVINNATWYGQQTFSYPTVIPNADKMENILDNTYINIWWDGETTPSVNAPIGSFFGMGQFGPGNTKALMMGIDDNNTMYMFFPMPFQRSAKITLVNSSGFTIHTTYEIQHKPFNDSFDNVGYFKTQFNVTTSGGSLVTVLNDVGTGQLVGMVDSMEGVDSGGGYLENDERVYVDGSLSHCWHGTGTEDLFNGGWYFMKGPYTLPLSGHTVHDLKNGDDRVAAYRLFIQDCIPYRNKIEMNFEKNGSNSATASPVSSAISILAMYYHKDTVSLISSDKLTIQDSNSVSSHGYVTNALTSSMNNEYYEGEYSNVSVTATGRKFGSDGYSQFTVNLNETNNGVLLRRLSEASMSLQEARVYIDGQLVGVWNSRFQMYQTPRPRLDDFMIPASFTKNKHQITVRIENSGSSSVWSEFSYEAFSITIQASANTASDITSFSLAGNAGTIDTTNKTVAVTVPFGTTVTSLVPTIAVSTNATVVPNTGVANDFTNPVHYIVTAEDTNYSSDYLVTVTLAQPTLVASVSILPTSTSLIVNANQTLTATVSPTIATNQTLTWNSSNPLVATVDANGLVTAIKFGSATITVTTADGNFTANCVVSVTAIPPTITSLTISGTNATVNGSSITITLPFGTNVTALTPTITLPAGLTIDKTTAQDFTTPVTYTVTALDGTTKAYTVTVVLAAAPSSSNSSTTPSPKTSDNIPFLMILMLLASSLVSVLFVIFRKRAFSK